VLDAIMRIGNRDTANRMVSTCLANGELKEGMPADVLHALGFLGYSEARDVLWAHAQNADFYTQRSATLGLLNLSCTGLERQIEAAIRSCVGESLFPEFLPALARQANNPDLLQTIFDLGRTTASTDCNGGIVYGIALYGEVGRAYFNQLLFDPSWEAHSSGTGTQVWAYHGFRHLCESLADLARQLRTQHAALQSEDWEYRLLIWLKLAEFWLGEWLSPIRDECYLAEQAVDVYSAAFDWSSEKEDDSLIGLLHSNHWGNRDALYAIRERLSDRITADVFSDFDATPSQI
jgi:hypothetical protein